MTEDLIPDPPPGFVRSSGRGQFSTHNGPYFHKPPQDGLTFQAFFALPRHTNGIGIDIVERRAHHFGSRFDILEFCLQTSAGPAPTGTEPDNRAFCTGGPQCIELLL